MKTAKEWAEALVDDWGAMVTDPDLVHFFAPVNEDGRLVLTENARKVIQAAIDAAWHADDPQQESDDGP